MQIDYMRVVRVFDGELVSLSPRRAKSEGEPSPGMVLKIRVKGKEITLDDNVSGVIDDLAAKVEATE